MQKNSSPKGPTFHFKEFNQSTLIHIHPPHDAGFFLVYRPDRFLETCQVCKQLAMGEGYQLAWITDPGYRATISLARIVKSGYDYFLRSEK